MGPFKKRWTKEDVEKVIAENDPESLLYVPIVVSMNPPDCDWSQSICIRLADHPDSNVRGNAILGFGHLARNCGRLEKELVFPIISSALSDEHEYVRGHASDAVDDIQHFLGWDI